MGIMRRELTLKSVLIPVELPSLKHETKQKTIPERFISSNGKY